MKGFYKHYKGGLYHVEGIATHSESGELLVIYTNEKGELFARPRANFSEIVVSSEGLEIERFRRVDL